MIHYINSNRDLQNLSVNDNDIILFKSNNVFDANLIPANSFVNNGITVGYYGSGEKPILDGSALLSGAISEGNGVYKKIFDSNVFGNMSENGVPMKYITWASGAGIGNLTNSSFTYDGSTLSLYFKPSDGLLSGKEFRYSKSLYGLLVNSIAPNVITSNKLFDGLHLRQISRHGIYVIRSKNVKVYNTDIDYIGGFRDLGSNPINVGNGVEITSSSDNFYMENSIITNIFDSGVSPQLYDSNGMILSDIHFNNLIIDRCGMHGIEVTAHNAKNHIINSSINNFVISNISLDSNWSGNRNGRAIQVFINLNNKETSSINNFKAYNGIVNNVLYGAMYYESGGIHLLDNVKFNSIQSSINRFLSVNTSLKNQNILYKNTEFNNAPISNLTGPGWLNTPLYKDLPKKLFNSK